MGRQDRSVSEVTNSDADKWGSVPDSDIFFTATAHLVNMDTFPSGENDLFCDFNVKVLNEMNLHTLKLHVIKV